MEVRLRTKREAAAALAQALVAAEQPQLTTLPAAQYFTEWVSRIDRKPATLSTYRRLVEQRIVPALGSTPLADLSSGMLTTAYASWLGDGLSPHLRPAHPPSDQQGAGRRRAARPDRPRPSPQRGGASQGNARDADVDRE